MKEILNSRIEEELAQLSDFYLHNDKKAIGSSSFSLLSGRAGTLLVQSLLYFTTKNEKLKSAISRDLDDLIEFIENAETLSLTFCNGLAGIGWLFIYLHETAILDVDITFYLEDLDQILEKEVNNLLTKNDLDILHGAMGLGIYFLSRKNKTIIEKIITAMEASCFKNGNEIAWSRFDSYSTKEYIFDFGLAHGNASVVYFLGKCYKNNILPDRCKILLEGLFNFFAANLQDPKQSGSFYPSFKFVKEYKTINNTQRSRLGWCYGDLGILYTLHLVAGWLKNTLREEVYLSMLKIVSERRSKADTQVLDACFCHGSSGISYLYYKIYKRTGQNIFFDASIYWLEETFSMRNTGTGLLGYKFYGGEKLGWVGSSEMLNGIGGNCLLLLNLHFDIKNTNWDECFFLS